MPASISVLYTSGLFLKQQCVLIAVAWDETLSQVLRRTFFSSTDLNCPEGAHETRTIGVTDGRHPVPGGYHSAIAIFRGLGQRRTIRRTAPDAGRAGRRDQCSTQWAGW